jgi:glycosyltransferase involved in cell wall biosynthesis
LRAKAIARLGWKLYRRYVEQHGQPDLVHVQSAVFAGCAALLIEEREGVPFLVSEHSSALADGTLGSSEMKILESVTARALRRFAVSESLARLLTAALPEQCGPWLVMPNMVREHFLSAELMAHSPHRFVLAHISLLGPEKRLDLVVNSFQRVAEAHPEAELWIGGDGPNRAACHRHVTELGLSGRVRFLGALSRSEVVATLSETDALVHPSDYETFSVVCLEALAMGVPVIATRCGGPEDFINDAVGRLVPVDDVASLAQAMEDVLLNQKAFDARRLRQECATRFSPSALTQRWEQQYEDAIDSFHGR